MVKNHSKKERKKERKIIMITTSYGNGSKENLFFYNCLAHKREVCYALNFVEKRL